MKKRYLSIFFVVFLCFAEFLSKGWCVDLYVDPGVLDDSEDGSSWETAKMTIYGAYVVAVNGDKIHLKDAVHVPLSRNIYVTKELSWVNENEDNHFQECIIEPSDYALKIYNVKNTFTGITFRGGIGSCNLKIGHGALGVFSFCNFSNNNSTTSGGAILIHGDDNDYAEAMFDHCEFESNRTDLYGGAIGGAKCIVSCEDCVFQNNEALSGGAAVIVGMYYSYPPCEAVFDSCSFLNNSGGGDGGALYLRAGEYQIDRCAFEDNKAFHSGGSPGAGGAIYCYDTTNIKISDCIFLRNESTADGGGVRIINIYPHEEPTFTVTDCLFSYNKAKNGGGLHCGRESGGVVRNCIFSYNEAYSKNAGGLYNSGTVKEGGWMIVEYCLFYGNTSQYYGGGMYIAEYPWTIIRNCSFYENMACIDGDQIAGKSHVLGLEKAILINTICWGSGEHNQILGRYGNTFESVSFCGFPENKCSDAGAITNHNVYVYPDFVDPANKNLRLSFNSLCIDRGKNIGLNEDLDGKSVPIGFGVDIGAYEFLNHVGRPSYMPAQDAGYFLWQDADDRQWHLRWSGDSVHTYYYTGTLMSSGGFTDVETYSYEWNDELQVDTMVTSFSAYAGAGEDGIDFFMPAGAQISFELYIDEIEQPEMIHVGRTVTIPGDIPFTITGLPACIADFDSDCDVDGSDLCVFAVTFGTTNADPNFDRWCDFDNDRDVDGRDLAIFSAEFGKTDCQ